MTARTLFSDSQTQLVARVLNNSREDKLLSADMFLSMDEPVQCLSDDGHKHASLMLNGDKSQRDTLLFGESTSPVSSTSLPSQVTVGETELRASSVSTAIDEMASDSSTPSSEGQQDHIESLLQRLPDNKTLYKKSSPNSVLNAHGPILPSCGCLTDAYACAGIPIGRKIRNLGRLCRRRQKGQSYNLCRFVPVALYTRTHRTQNAGGAMPKTIGPCLTPPAAKAAGWPD